MNDDDVRLVVWVEVGLAVVLILGTLPWAAVVKAADAHEGLAAWAQLAGVFLALGVTILAARMPVDHSREQDRRRLMRAHITAVQSALVTAGTITAFQQAIVEHAPELDGDWINLQAQEASDALQKVPLGEFEAPGIGQALGLMRLALRGAKNSTVNAMNFHAQPASLAQALADAQAWERRGLEHAREIVRIANEAGCDFRVDGI
jgi:hypothetical protein